MTSDAFRQVFVSTPSMGDDEPPIEGLSDGVDASGTPVVWLDYVGLRALDRCHPQLLRITPGSPMRVEVQQEDGAYLDIEESRLLERKRLASVPIRHWRLAGWQWRVRELQA